MNKSTIKPFLILGSIIIGCLMMWIGSSSDLINSIRIPILFGGALLALAAFAYCGYLIYKIISNKL